MDAITLLKDDHRSVERLFKRFENTTDRATVERRRIVDDIIRELSVHAEIEETIFYPAVRKAVPQAEDEILEALEEHHVAKWVLSELEGMDPGAERFEAKVTVMMENVRHHVKEEESDLFPQVRKSLSRKTLDDMGEAMARAKTIAPTRPHPRSPDTPPGNIVTGVVASALDRAREAGQELVENAASAARRATGNDGAAPRRPARRKAAAKKATRTAKRTAKKATRTTKATTRKAAGAGKRTTKKATTTAKRTAKQATGTAKRTAKRTTKKATGTAKKATTTAKRTAKKATGTAKRTAKRTTKKATGTAKKATRTAKTTGRKATSRPRKAAKKRS